MAMTIIVTMNAVMAQPLLMVMRISMMLRMTIVFLPQRNHSGHRHQKSLYTGRRKPSEPARSNRLRSWHARPHPESHGRRHMSVDRGRAYAILFLKVEQQHLCLASVSYGGISARKRWGRAGLMLFFI